MRDPQRERVAISRERDLLEHARGEAEGVDGVDRRADRNERPGREERDVAVGIGRVAVHEHGIDERARDRRPVEIERETRLYAVGVDRGEKTRERRPGSPRNILHVVVPREQGEVLLQEVPREQDPRRPGEIVGLVGDRRR